MSATEDPKLNHGKWPCLQCVGECRGSWWHNNKCCSGTCEGHASLIDLEKEAITEEPELELFAASYDHLDIHALYKAAGRDVEPTGCQDVSVDVFILSFKGKICTTPFSASLAIRLK